MKIKHLWDKRNANLRSDENSLWSRIGIGWEILVEEKRKKDLLILMDLCDESDHNRLFEVLMSIVDEQNLKPHVEDPDRYHESIKEWINCNPGDDKLIRAMKIFNCYEIIGSKFPFNSDKDDKNHKLWKKVWKSDDDTEDSLFDWIGEKRISISS